MSETQPLTIKPGCLDVVTIVLVILKLFNLIAWPWLLVLLPFWLPTLIYVFIKIAVEL